MVADAAYLLLVFSWMLFLPPLGRDFVSLARPNTLEPVAGAVFRGCMQIFGAHPWPYHAFNLLLLYACMMLILILTRHLVRGPWWLGSVAAVLFMANPVKTEAVLHLDGMRDLLPALAGLFALLSYMALRGGRGAPPRYTALLLFLAAAGISPTNLMLMPVFAVYEAVCRPKPEGWRFFRPIGVVGAVALLASGMWAVPGALHPLRMFAPLALIFYPIGMLPENAELLAIAPSPAAGVALVILELAPVVSVVLLLMLIIAVFRILRRLREPSITFGVLGALAFRLFQGSLGVDAVTLQGGGRLLIPLALLSIAAAGLCHRLMKMPECRRYVVRISTAACALVMALQVASNLEWRRAAREVERFRTAAERAHHEHPGQPLAVLPDYQYLGTAPLQFSSTVRYNTLFSRALPVHGLLPMHRIPGHEPRILKHAPERIELEVPKPPCRRVAALRLIPGPWRRRPRVPSQERIVLTPEGPPFPEVRIPYP